MPIRYNPQKKTITNDDGPTRSHFTFFNMNEKTNRKSKKRSDFTKDGTTRSKYNLGER